MTTRRNRHSIQVCVWVCEWRVNVRKITEWKAQPPSTHDTQVEYPPHDAPKNIYLNPACLHIKYPILGARKEN